MATKGNKQTTIKAWKEFLQNNIDINELGYSSTDIDEDGNEIECEREFDYCLFEDDLSSLKYELQALPYPVVFTTNGVNYNDYDNKAPYNYDVTFEDANAIFKVFEKSYARGVMARVENGKIELPVYDLGGGIILPQVLELKVTKK